MILMRDDSLNDFLFFENPLRVLRVDRVDAVRAAIREAEEATRGGLYAAGFVCYEAAPAFEASIPVHPAKNSLPLAYFEIFESVRRIRAEELSEFFESRSGQKTSLVPCPENSRPATDAESDTDASWTPSLNSEGYSTAISAIRERLAAGDTYQVNFTFDLESTMSGDPLALFLAIVRTHPVPYAAFIELDSISISSFSPELFFRREGRAVTCKPMKGTSRRGRNNLEDESLSAALRSSEKEKAENLMVVDMIRNDLGRIAIPGSVKVPRLFEVERYATVLQMTSTVTAESSADLEGIFEALFPCASITGAPKISSSRIIYGLEGRPRGLYCGAIGFAAPGSQAQFNVAIRTLVRNSGRSGRSHDGNPEDAHARVDSALYSVGSGIVWDSDTSGEYEECLAKGRVVTRPRPDFDLVETLRFDPGLGFRLLPYHAARCEDSARYFGFSLAVGAFSEYCRQTGKELAGVQGAVRVRITISRDGRLEHSTRPLGPAYGNFREVFDTSEFAGAVETMGAKERMIPVRLSRDPVNPADPFLFHKTTMRSVYDAALATRGTVAALPDDVILWNQAGELTETTIGNLVVRVGDEFLTPPIRCGLLAGTMRSYLLETGRIREDAVHVAHLNPNSVLYRINSVRGIERLNFPQE